MPVGLQPALRRGEEGPPAGLWVLGSCLDLFPEPRIQAHMGGVDSPGFLPPKNLKILPRLLSRSAEIIQPSPLEQALLLVHATGVQPPNLPRWVCFLLSILSPTSHSSRLLVLITARQPAREAQAQNETEGLNFHSVICGSSTSKPVWTPWGSRPGWVPAKLCCGWRAWRGTDGSLQGLSTVTLWGTPSMCHAGKRGCVAHLPFRDSHFIKVRNLMVRSLRQHAGPVREQSWRHRVAHTQASPCAETLQRHHSRTPL